jgi:tRNA(Ile)-lysidine synthase TilS/MesJ
MEQARTRLDGDSFCAYCARMKRGIMYATCREQGYNVLALAQHLDDLAESFLMSAFHQGRLGTMKAHYINDAGDLRIIRPLVYVRETQTAAFADSARLPIITDSCPACFSAPTQREHMKALLAREEKGHPNLFANLLTAMRPLMGEKDIEVDMPEGA